MVAASLLAATADARAEESPLFPTGRQVVLKSRESALKVGKDVVESPDAFRVYRVERVNGDWLWITAQGSRGWVRSGQVVPLDQALEYFTRIIDERPGDPWPRQMRGLVYAQFEDFERAVADDSAALQLDPANPIAYHNRGNARLAVGDRDGAIDDYNRATELDPKDAASYAQRALAWSAKHEYDLAIADDNQAIRLSPNDAGKYRQRAIDWTARQDFAQALADYAEALLINPNDALAYNGQAWIWATAPDASVRDGKKAVNSAERARELTRGTNPYILGTLAAASAEAGKFNAAVHWQTEALKQFAARNIDLNPHRQRLELYRAGKPFRDAPRN